MGDPAHAHATDPVWIYCSQLPLDGDISMLYGSCLDDDFHPASAPGGACPKDPAPVTHLTHDIESAGQQLAGDFKAARECCFVRVIAGGQPPRV